MAVRPSQEAGHLIKGGAGVALNPGTPLAAVEEIVTEVDALLVMIVDPGFGAQSLIPAPVAYCLWQRHLRFGPADPVWPDRDRFVLSNGHASMLLYSLLHLTGVQAVNPKYEVTGKPSVSLDDIKAFRQLGSRCPDHPEYRWTPGVETTSGPLRQGVAASRPADANEVTEAWRVIMPLQLEPAVLVLSRQPLPTLDRTRYAAASGLARGAYVLADAPGQNPEVILIGTGSEVALCAAAYESLTTEGIAARVVSMPSWELTEQQEQAYCDLVLAPRVRARVAVEEVPPSAGAGMRAPAAPSSVWTLSVPRRPSSRSGPSSASSPATSSRPPRISWPAGAGMSRATRAQEGGAS
jgi:transketolase